MRQRWWLELVKDYNCEILYHPGKANRVANALSRKSSVSLTSLIGMTQPSEKEIQDFSLELATGQLTSLTLTSTLYEDIQEKQERDPIF